jgi:hypothetical protein
LTIDKSNRAIIEPKNDLFLELDFNAAELRTLLSLTEKDQPDVDIHTWITEKIFKNKYSREEVKQKVFAWLYNNSAKNKKLNELFERDKILEYYYKEGAVQTPFNRKIDVDERKAVNYLIQSTTSDLVLRQAIKLNDTLEGTKSFVSFVMHDSIIIDIHREERHMLDSLIEIFQKTDLGSYRVNVSLGKNYGDMKKVKWQQ